MLHTHHLTHITLESSHKTESSMIAVNLMIVDGMIGSYNAARADETFI